MTATVGTVWENIEYRAENRMLKLLHELPWRNNEAIRGLMQRAGRQLLLLQASVGRLWCIRRGCRLWNPRFSGHATNFDRATLMAEEAAAGRELSAIRKTELQEMDQHDSIFPNIDLSWWM